MKEISKYIISLVIIVASVGGMAGLFALKKDPENKPVVDTNPTAATFEAVPFDGNLGIELSGIVVSYREINLAAEVAGRIEVKANECEAGNFVKAGTLLLSVEKADYDLEIKRLKAELNQSQVMIRELEDEIAGLRQTIDIAKEDLELQQGEYSRRLAARDALSVSELNQSRQNLNAAERAVTELNNSLSVLTTRKSRLESGIELSQIELEKAQLNLARTEIRAPFDGVIVSELVEQGDFVQKGEQVVTMEDTSKSEVKCHLRLSQLERILKYRNHHDTANPAAAYQLPPTPVTVHTTGLGSSFNWSGTLVGFDGIGVDEQSKTIPCRVVVDFPITTDAAGHQKALVRGMFVKVNIDLDSTLRSNASPLLMFPEVAVHPGDLVWTIADGKLARHKIKLIDRQLIDANPSPDGKDYLRKMVIATTAGDSIQPGDLVVVTPLSQPTPGVEMTILEQYQLPTEAAAEVESSEATRLASPRTGDPS